MSIAWSKKQANAQGVGTRHNDITISALRKEPTVGQEWKLLDVGHAGEWAFVGGPWQRDGEGLMRPPTEVVDENLAVYTPHHFGELEAESKSCGFR